MADSSGSGATGTPPGWYQDAQGSTRWWDGSSWTEQVQETGAKESSGNGNAITGAVSAITQAAEFPEGTVWSAIGKPISHIGAGRYHLDDRFLYFERSGLRTNAQQVPIADVLDVDVKQSLSQKARGVYSVNVHIQRPSGVEIVSMEDIPDGRTAQRVINDHAHAARLARTQVQNTVRYEGTHPAAPSASTLSAGSDDFMVKLKELAELKSAGLLSDEEFAAAKAKLLG